MRNPAKKRVEECGEEPDDCEDNDGHYLGDRMLSPPPMGTQDGEEHGPEGKHPLMKMSVAFVKREHADMVGDAKALPSFNHLINGNDEGGEGGEGKDNHQFEHEDDDIAEDEDIEDSCDGVDNLQQLPISMSNDKVYADLDAVPTTSAAAAFAAAAAAATGGYHPYPPPYSGSYYDGRGVGPPPPPDYGAYHGPPPGAGLYDPSSADHHHPIYTNPTSSSTSASPSSFRYAGEIPQPAHQGSHALLAAPAPAVASAQATAVAAASGATLILPPEPSTAPEANNHCILIQRVPQRHRKNRGGELQLSANFG